MPEVVRSEMVANVIQLLVSPGDIVAAGEPVVVLESMKMEIPVLCEHGGEVLEVGVSEGDVVQEGDVLVQLG